MSQPANDDYSQHLSDDEASYHEDASDNGTATNKPKQQQQQLTPTTTTISNIKLLILKKEEMELQRREISTGKDGTSEKIHGMDDAKSNLGSIMTSLVVMQIQRRCRKLLKQQFEAFTISSSEGLEKGYDRFHKTLSLLVGSPYAEVSTEDANHKFLRSLPPAWLNLAMTMRTKLDVDTLSIDDLYNNLRVFEQELTSTSKSSVSAQNVAFVSHSKSSTNKVKSGHTSAYSTCTPTSSNNFQEREVTAGFADEIAMIAIRMKKFYKKTGRRVRIDGNKPVGFDKKKLECFKCHNTGHFARECPSKGTNDGKKRDSFYQDQGAGKKEQNQNCLLTMDDGVVNWGEHTVEEEETNHALMAINSNTEVSLCSKTCIDSYNKLKTLCDEQMNQLGEQEAKILAYTLAVKKLEAQIVTFQKQQLSLNEQLTFQANEIYAKDEKLKRYRRIGMKAVKEKEQLQKICTEKDFLNKPLYSRFSKTDNFKGVPHPLTGDYTPKTTKKEIDDSFLSHLIRDCDFYEKKMAREAELKKQRVFITGNGVAKPVWNNANRVNHANHFVPRPVQLNTGRANVNSVRANVNSVRPNVNTGRANVNYVRVNVNSVRPNVNTGRANVNSVRPNVNTGRANVNSVRQNINSVRSNVNTGSFNINTVKAKQPINTSNSNSFSPGNWGTTVKTSASYNWRKTRPNSNCNSGYNFIRNDHPLKNMNDKSEVFKTPTQIKTLGEEDISPTTLEAAKTLSKVASQRTKSIDKGKRYKRRKESKGKDISTDFEDISTGLEDISTGFKEVNTGGLGVSTGSGLVSSARGQREGKVPMIVEETQAPKTTKEQILQEEASLAEAIRLQTLEEEETAKQVHLDALLAKRLVEEEELTEQQKKIKAQLSQLKKLKFEEIKEEFEKLVKQIDTFVPINIKATKAQLKRYGEELQTKISKKQRIDDKDVSDTEEKVGKVKEEEPVKRVGKRKKQKARKGISIDKTPQGDSKTDKEESVEAMNPTPLDTKSNIGAN
ncbi:ribonuclease H-like domain-containing protein [Tanacetum coccineum]